MAAVNSAGGGGGGGGNTGAPVGTYNIEVAIPVGNTAQDVFMAVDVQ